MFCKKIGDYVVKDEEKLVEVDFNKVKNCDPFPMLVVSTALRNMRKQNKDIPFVARNCNNKYAEYMKFYKACGIGL